MRVFVAKIEIVGINPYVFVPAACLEALLKAVGRERGPIPIVVRIGNVEFKQTLVKFQGAYRLYLNTPMRRAAGKDVGDRIKLGVAFDPSARVEPIPAALERLLKADKSARAAFEALAPSRRKEIARYLNALKTPPSMEKNLRIVLRHLKGEKASRPAAFLRGSPKARSKAS